MKLFVIGKPIKHSLSPLIHNCRIKKYNIEVSPSYYPLQLMKPFEKYYLDCPNNLDNSIKNSNSTFLLPFGNRFPLNLVDETIKRVEIVLKEGMIELSN